MHSCSITSFIEGYKIDEIERGCKERERERERERRECEEREKERGEREAVLGALFCCCLFCMEVASSALCEDSDAAYCAPLFFVVASPFIY